jgi:hypothetical protein
VAAFQFELKRRSRRRNHRRIEGGDHPAFKSAPYYDPAALTRNRIIVAAFNTGSDLQTPTRDRPPAPGV